MAARLALVVACAAAAAALLGVSAADVGTCTTRWPNRDNSICPASGFYTYDAFIQAANAFPGFGTGGTDERNRRDLAAFFDQTSHETTGGSADQFDWGYCFKEERDKATSPPYYGRGPIQLTGQSNYEMAGAAPELNVDLVNNPDLVSTNPVISFKTAIWFWMTAQPPKPSCHDVALGDWTPSSGDSAAGRVPGYGAITNIINGMYECGVGTNDGGGNANRIGYYKRYCDMLGVSPGDNLDCYSQQKFG
ncbi:hypothetical protein U9M48_007880 [Paspalum notatum var. saurae]|uniref:chitinase n=1 Tax=Paspalum notatum var. saurae TaxID=547442 RepID=A0AAQ3WCG1_PASNO